MTALDNMYEIAVYPVESNTSTAILCWLNPCDVADEKTDTNRFEIPQVFRRLAKEEITICF